MEARDSLDHADSAHAQPRNLSKLARLTVVRRGSLVPSRTPLGTAGDETTGGGRD